MYKEVLLSKTLPHGRIREKVEGAAWRRGLRKKNILSQSDAVRETYEAERSSSSNLTHKTKKVGKKKRKLKNSRGAHSRPRQTASILGGGTKDVRSKPQGRPTGQKKVDLR